MKLNDQSRWNSYGDVNFAKNAKGDLIISKSPLEAHDQLNEIFKSELPCVEGKKILDLGCGLGKMSVYLSKQGAEVTGIDIGDKLIESAKRLAVHNQVNCKFVIADSAHLPFEKEKFDIVICLGVLHHLKQCDVEPTVKEIYRVLKKDGKFFINEPIEESKIFEFFQNLIPIKQCQLGEARPSMLDRNKWKQYQAKLDERSFKIKELTRYFEKFKDLRLIPHGIFNRLERIFPRYRRLFNRIDEKLIRRKIFNKFCRTMVICGKK